MYTSAFSLGPAWTFLSVCAQREQGSSLVPLKRTLILSDYGPTFMAPFNFNYFCRGLIQLQPHWGGASVCEFGGHKHLVCNAWLPCIRPREMTRPYSFFCLFLIKLGLGTSTAKSGKLWWLCISLFCFLEAILHHLCHTYILYG